MREYAFVISDGDAQDFIDKINEAASRGYVLIGPIQVTGIRLVATLEREKTDGQAK